jgi:hypothetical protein
MMRNLETGLMCAAFVATLLVRATVTSALEHSLLAKLGQNRDSRSGAPRRISADLFVGDGQRKMSCRG